MDVSHLHDQVWPECSHTRDTDARFSCAVRGSCAPEYHGRCNSALHASIVVSRSIPLIRNIAMEVEVMGRAGHTMPMNGANLGDSSESAMIAASLFCSGAQELVVQGRCLPSEMCLGGVDFEVVLKACSSSLVACSNGGSVECC